MIYDLGFRVQGAGFGVCVWGLGFGVWGLVYDLQQQTSNIPMAPARMRIVLHAVNAFTI